LSLYPPRRLGLQLLFLAAVAFVAYAPSLTIPLIADDALAIRFGLECRRGARAPGNCLLRYGHPQPRTSPLISLDFHFLFAHNGARELPWH
jgi:hypothetical protein